MWRAGESVRALYLAKRRAGAKPWETTVRVSRELNEIISTTFPHVGVDREIFRLTAPSSLVYTNSSNR